MQNIKKTINTEKMIYKKSILLFAIVIILFTTFSCKKEDNNKNKKKVSSSKQIEYVIEFPDTVYLNQKYDGIIKYKSILDTITTSFDDKKKNRYVLFYLTIVDKPDPDNKHLKKAAKILGANNNREIFIDDIIFTKIGTYYIDGIINDYVVIDINKKDNEGFGLVREIENEERVIHKVVVIEKPNPPTNKSKQK